MKLEERFGLKRSKLILLFFQMILTIILFITSIYLLAFSIHYHLGGWMISSYLCITVSIIAIVIYSINGYKKGDFEYQMSIVPFLVAIFINILLPTREMIQVGLLVILFSLTFAFLLRLKDYKFTTIISILMAATSLIFSIYSSFKADTQFLGELSAKWYTYVAMYLSIFIPTITSGTLGLTYNLRNNKKQDN